ncbi:MAG: hypothetical protein HF973_13280 [Chloroflexi bacterium]|nr:hypothetical protein [Chloroflexota bacterium]
MTEKRWIALILALFILLGAIYAVTTPVFEASDELWHYPMVRHLADGNPLPVQVFDPALAGPWNQEASQPPLYYYLGAALTFWLDTSDMEAIRWLNPHVDNGIITADGNNNLAVHNPVWNPLQGTLLAVRIVRLFSVLLGAATVYLTYRIGREAVPDRLEIGLGAAAVNAFMPMFIFISGAVNNDNLAIPLASLALLLLIRMIGKRYSVTGDQCSVFSVQCVGRWVLIGVVVGLALLTKEGTFALLPLVGGTAVLSQWQAYRAKTEGGDLAWRQWLAVLGRGILIFGLTMIPALLIAGWWYVRNLNLYGDLLGWSAFIAVLGQRAHPASLIQLWSERRGFMMAYWGLFGGVNIPMPAWIYTILNGVLVIAVLGFVVFVIGRLRDWRLEIRDQSPISNLQSPTSNLQSLISNLFLFVERYFALVVCFLFASAVVYGLIKWATTTWSSQGRLVFTALSALCVLLVVGLVGWLPPRPSRWIVGALAGFLFVVAAAAPFLWIQPAYATGRYTEIANPTDTAVTFGNKMQLTGYELAQKEAQPGDEIDLWLAWEVLQPMARDWSVFVHLTDPVLGVPIAQRDMYPDQGLRPTSLLRPGERIVNFYRLSVPDTAVAPADLALNVGLYDYETGERLALPDGRDLVMLDVVRLTAVPGQTPNPVSVNFEKGVELVGYELEPRRAAAGDTLDLTLYWQLNQPLPEDYTFFAQVVDEDTTRWASQDLPVPTATWETGQVIPVPMTLILSEETPPGVYPIIIGLYTRTEDGSFARLQRITDDGRPTDDFLQLTLVRVD